MTSTPLPTEPIDVVVVGGGLAGLTAAATAARGGASVAVLDGRSLGGRARSTVRAGFTLNEGGHALYRAGGGWAVLADLGVHPRGGTPPNGAFRAVWNGSIVRLPTDARSTLTSRVLSLRSKRRLGAWFSDLPGLAAGAPDVAFGDWLDGEGAGDDLRKYFLAVTRLATYAAQPEHLPAAAALRQLVAGADGVAYLDGGWQTLVDQLAAVAASAGATLHDHTTATSVAGGPGEWTVETASGPVIAGSVILATPPAVAVSLLGADPAGWVERAGPPQRAAVLDIGGADGPHQLLLSADEPLYVARHAPVARLAPDGQALHTAMRYLAPDDAGTSADHRADLERHATLAGLPTTGDRTLERFLAAPVVTWGTPVVGIARPTGLEQADRGLFVAGDWLGDRMLADASITSGSTAGADAARRAMVAA